MEQPTGIFAEVLETIDRMPVEDQEALIEIVRHRALERNRKRLAAEVQEARREFEGGRCKPATAGELMDEILS